MALTSKELYSLAQQFLYRSLRFIFNRSRRPCNRLLLQRLIANKAINLTIRTLWIPWAPKGIARHGDDGSLEDLHLLAQLVPQLARLRTFIWEAQYPIPVWLLDALHKQQSCRLCIRLPYGSNTAQALANLQGFSRLWSLDVLISNSQRQALAGLGRLLSQATSLRSLAFHHCNDDGSSTYPILTYQLEQCPNLKSLALEDCGFSTEPNHNLSENTDRPMIKSLFMSNMSFLRPDLATRLTNIRSLKLRPSNLALSRLHPYLERLQAFLSSCQRLEDLDLDGLFAGDCEPILRSNGRTLLSLRIANTNLTPGLIGLHCPKLRKFGIDIGRSKEWEDWVCYTS